MTAAACGGGSRDDDELPQIIETFHATNSPTPTPAPTAVPSTPSPTAARSNTPTPTPSDTPGPNRSPGFPQQLLTGVDTTYTRDDSNATTGAVTTMVAPEARPSESEWESLFSFNSLG